MEDDFFMDAPIVGNIDGDDVVKIEGTLYRVMWKNQMPPEPVLVEVEE